MKPMQNCDLNSRNVRWNASRRLVLKALSPLAVLALCTVGFSSKAFPIEGGKVSFSRDVAPILARSCQGCHSDAKTSMGFNLSSYAKLRKGGKQSGPDEMIVPGKPEESHFFETLTANAQPRMPLKLKPLAEIEIGLIKRWIAEGALCDAPSPETPLVILVPPEKVLASTTQIQVKSSPASVKSQVALSNDAKLLAVSSGDQIRVYDLQRNDKPLKTLGPLNGMVESIWIDTSAACVVAASGRPGLEGIISKWSLADGKRMFEKTVHTDQILDLKVELKSGLIATASYDKTIALSDLNTGNNISSLREHTDAVYGVDFVSGNHLRLVSVSGDRTLKLWDLKSFKRLETMSESTAELYGVAVSNDGRIAYAAGVDRTIRAYDLSVMPPRLVRSALAHDGPITGLNIISTLHGQELVSRSEDRSIRRWNASSLAQSGLKLSLEDWPTSISCTTNKIAASTFSGDVFVYDISAKEPKVLWQKPARSERGGMPDSFKPSLVRSASLNPPAPRIVHAGGESMVTLTGNGIENASKVWVYPPDILATVVTSSPPKANTLQLKLKVPARRSFGVASVRLATAAGITPEQTIGLVQAVPKVINAIGADFHSSPIHEIKKNEVVQTTISAPGQKFSASVQAVAGETLTVTTLAKRVGSSLSAKLSLKGPDGKTLATASSLNRPDAAISFHFKESTRAVIELTDTQFTGGGNHFAWIYVDHSPLAQKLDAVAVSTEVQTALNWVSATGEIKPVPAPASTVLKAGQLVPVSPPDGWEQDRSRSVVFTNGRVVRSNENKTTLKPGDVWAGSFQKSGMTDTVFFEAKDGERLTVETLARRLGLETDTAIDIFDEKNQPVTQAVLRKVADTLIAFRDHASTIKGIRLTQWPDFQMRDYVLINREVARIFQLPRNPDDDCQFFGDEQRWGYFGTTPEQHPMARTVTKLEIVPPGQENSIDPNLLVKLPFANDDAGMAYGNDSHIDFKAPHAGVYHINIRESQGRSGAGLQYALMIRRPMPDFQVSITPMDWTIPAGGGRLITASIRRLDSFDGPVEIQVEGLPAGLKASPCQIEAGQVSADFLIWADPKAKLAPDADWKIKATAQIDGIPVVREIQSTFRGWSIVPDSNIRITTAANMVDIRPGGISTLEIKADRAEAFKGRIPMEVKNLPYGVRVLDIGLNGVLITEKESKRTIRIYCEPWVTPQSRPFYISGKAESAGTNDTAPAVMLNVLPAKPAVPTTSVGQN